MLDAIGASRGSDGRELAALRQTWTKAVVASFERSFINAETVNCDGLVRAG